MFDFIKHWLVPHERNNFRSKLVHNSSLSLLIIVILFATVFLNFIQVARPDILGISYSMSEGELLALVNQKRQEAGLPPLSLNAALSDASRRKASDMLAKNYWAHFAPDGSTSPWGFIRDAGYNYTFAGENLAKGFTDSGSVVNAWMASQTHRDNILSSKYNDVGFAIVPGTLNGEETVLVVEMFGSTGTRTIAQVPEVAQASEQAPEPTVVVSTPIPTSTPVIVAIEEVAEPASPPAQVKSQPTIDSATTPKAASTVGLSFLAFAFLMDLVIVERKKIPRIVGQPGSHYVNFIVYTIYYVLRKGINNMIRKIPHGYYYVLELLVLLAGFALIIFGPQDFIFQLIALGSVLSIYSFLGIYHHSIHHTAHKRIVIEYVLISILIFVIFLFLNINKL